MVEIKNLRHLSIITSHIDLGLFQSYHEVIFERVSVSRTVLFRDYYILDI